MPSPVVGGPTLIRAMAGAVPGGDNVAMTSPAAADEPVQPGPGPTTPRTEPDVGPIPGRQHPSRVAIVGVGFVGSTFAYALLLSGLAAEIVLIDANRRRAEGEAMDLNHTVPFAHPTRIWAEDYADCAGAAVSVIAAGGQPEAG